MPLFYTLKRERLYAGLCGLQVLCTIPVLVIAAHTLDLVAVAAGRTLVAGIFFGVFCWVATGISGVRMSDFGQVLWRPATASVCMALAVDLWRDTALPGHILPMMHDIAVGIVVFAGVQIGLWLLAGRPRGAESIIWSRLETALPRRLRRN
jgi:hypothetical protein